MITGSLFSPITQTSRGLKKYLQGVMWLRAHPKQLLMLFLPMVFALVLLGVGWNLFFSYEETIFGWILFDKPESAWLVPLYWLCKVLLYVGFFAVGILGAVLVANIAACPFYEIVSCAVERDVMGGDVVDIGLWNSVKLITEELKKVVFILTISITILFIPGLNLVATLITAFLVGWDFYDYPLARRGWSFRERLMFVMKDFWAVLGLGLWLVIPLVQFILLPMAVAGGSMLSLETIQKNQVGR